MDPKITSTMEEMVKEVERRFFSFEDKESMRLLSKLAADDEVQGANEATKQFAAEVKLEKKSIQMEVQGARKKTTTAATSKARSAYYKQESELTIRFLWQAQKAQEKGQNDIADLWKQCGHQYYLATVNDEKKAEAILAHNEKEAISWKQARNGAILASRSLKEAIEAGTQGKNEETLAWCQAAQEEQLRCENHTKAAIAWAAGKEREATSWDYAGAATGLAAEYLKKVIKVETQDKEKKTIAYRQVAKEWQLCCKNKIQAAIAWAEDKEREATSWDQAGIAADWAAAFLKKAIEADTSTQEKVEEAIAWRQAAQEQQLRCENKTKAAMAWADGKEREATSWDHAGDAASWTAAFLKRDIEAGTQGKDEEATTWRQATKTMQEAQNQWSQGAEAYARELVKNGNEYDQEGRISFIRAYERVVELRDLQEEKAKAAGKENEQWKEVVRLSQLMLECSLCAAEAMTKTDSKCSWKELQSRLHTTGWTFYASHSLTKVIEARSLEKMEEAREWEEIAREYQYANHYCTQAAEAYAAGNLDQGESFDKEGDSIGNKAWQLQQKMEENKVTALDLPSFGEEL